MFWEMRRVQVRAWWHDFCTETRVWRATNEVTTQRSAEVRGESLTRIQQFLMLIWYFLTDRAAVEAVIEEKLRTMPETQAQRIRQRWERSRERARRKE